MLIKLVIFAKNCNYTILVSFYIKNLWIYIEKLELSAIYNVKKCYDMLKNGIFCKLVILVIFCKNLIC